jgi:hypothetical protein
LNVEVALKIAMSPVHPRRSSRCGQSVGIDSMLLRSPHRMLCSSWLSIALDVVNVPSCGPLVHAARPVSVSAVGVKPDGAPVSST